MKPNETHDRETLSALFDGELDGEARLFALRRLSHDAGWQDDCGRWQLLGDVMRRQASIAAPADFAGRVQRAIAEVPATLSTAPWPQRVATVARRPARLWAGGALAASLALVGVYALAPRGGVSPAPAPAPAVAASVQTSPVPVVATRASTPASAVAGTALSVAQDDAARGATPAATRATQDSPRLAAAPARAPQRAAASHAARRESLATSQQAARVATAAPTLPAASLAPAVAPNPFHVLATDPLAARPWPRAALGGAGALTASYGTPAAAPVAREDAPSFYPFEPRPHGGAVTQGQTP